MAINNLIPSLNIFIFESAQKNKENFFDPISAEYRLKVFLDFYLQEKFFRKITVFNSMFLRNKSRYHLVDDHFYIKTLEQALLFKIELYKSCFSKGHLSVLFELENDDVLLIFMKLEQLYVLSEKQPFSSQMLGFIKNEDDRKEFKDSLDMSFDKKKSIVAFSHDALNLCFFSFGSGKEFYNLKRNTGEEHLIKFEKWFQNGRFI